MTEERLPQKEHTEVITDSQTDAQREKSDLPESGCPEISPCQTQHPHQFKCGDILVNIQFSDSGERTVRDALVAYLRSVKKGNRRKENKKQ